MIVKCTVNAARIRSLPLIENSTDLNKRLMLNQTATVYGKSIDNKWLYLDAPAARGWVSADLVVEDNNVVITSPAWPRVPNGLAEIKALFGEAGKPVCQAGRVKLPKELKLSWENQKIVVFACHKLIEDVLTSVFTQIDSRGLWDLLEEYGGCYEYRNTRASSHLSCHAWGIAIDLNPKTNPLGGIAHMDSRIVTIFKDHGFFWGNDFQGRKDPMHFQYARGY